MAKEFYRFRSLGRLFKELETQTIYFASPSELNDPMEGFINLVFKGDKIVWRNFFKHYLFCLECTYSLFLIFGEKDHIITDKDIPIFKGFDEFPTIKNKENFEKISKRFFKYCTVLTDKISMKKVKINKNELVTYLMIINSIAIKIIEQQYNKKEEEIPLVLINHMKKIVKLIDLRENIEKNNKDELKKILIDEKIIINRVFLSSKEKSKTISELSSNNFFCTNFPAKYLSNIEKIMYPKWYAACFMFECNNSSAWGHYADGHKGVCLIFESDEENKITFSKEQQTLKFEQIKYQEGFEKNNFFSNINNFSKDKLKSTWYTDENNNISDIFEDILNNNLSKINQNILRKTKDWEYEKEYRLILEESKERNITKKERLLEYDFNSLKGIIFGINTSLEDKMKITEIIEQKCKENEKEDFEFYQAYYCDKNKNIQMVQYELYK